MQEQRKIIHVDMDCFFAAVEMRDNPALRDIPMAIGGRVNRGVIATCNYPARAYGVRSAMPTGQALKLCPHLTLVPGQMEKYRQASEHIRTIMQRYTDLIEPLSMDEAYLDVTGSTSFQGSATRIAEDLRRAIFVETGLTASAGVAPNKFLAKIASDENKPNGLCVVRPDQVDDFVQNLPLKRIPGIGQKTAERLAAIGWFQCGDVREAPLHLVVKHCGSFAESLLQRVHGIDHRSVNPARERKSVGLERTLTEDLISEEECLHKALELWPRLLQRLETGQHLNALKSIGVKLKFNDFMLTTAEKSCHQVTPADIAGLLAEAWQRGHGKPVRLVGLHAGLADVTHPQLSLPFESF